MYHFLFEVYDECLTRRELRKLLYENICLEDITGVTDTFLESQSSHLDSFLKEDGEDRSLIFGDEDDSTITDTNIENSSGLFESGEVDGGSKSRRKPNREELEFLYYLSVPVASNNKTFDIYAAKKAIDIWKFYLKVTFYNYSTP